MTDYLAPRSGGRGFKRETTVDSSAGAADAGKLISLDADGLLDRSFLPDVATITVPASEALGAGDFVSLFNDGGTVKARLADRATAIDADGFVKAAVALDDDALVYRHGVNDQLAGLTLGADYYLDDAGAVSAARTSTVGEVDQYLGVAISATELDVTIAQPVEL